MLPLVQLENVTVIAGGRELLRNVSLSLNPGEALLLGGPNGGGKTTLLRLLAGQIAPISGTRTYALGGQLQPSAVQARRTLSIVGPDAEAFYLTRDWELTVRSVLLAGAEGEHLPLWEATPAQLTRLDEVTRLTGLEPLLERDFRTLSHGQRRRTLLARALMPAPELLLLDEFTDGLSEKARTELGEVLRGLHAAGMAIVLATHRPDEVPQLGWRSLRVVGGEVASEHSEMENRTESVRPSPLFRVPDAAQHSKPLVQIQNAEVFRNGHRALGPLSWTWQTGQHWLVTGENGSGKSTLARLIAGEFYPARTDSALDSRQAGKITRPFLRRDVLAERRKHIGLVSAEVGIRQRFNPSGREWLGRDVIASAFAGSEGFTGDVTPEQWQAVDELAARLELAELLARDVQALSQGQLRRLLLARAVVHRPTLLLLDEGLDFVDARSRAQFSDLLPDLLSSGTHLLVIAHREADAWPGLTHHLRLEAGKVAGETQLI